MSSNQYFTQINNALLDGNTMLSSLTGPDVNALLFAGAISRNPIITVAGTGTTYALTAADLIQATNNVQLVNGSGLTAVASLTLGSDLPATAAQYVNLFQLTSGSGGKVLMRFQVDQKAQAAFNLSLANNSGTSNYVVVQLSGASSAGTQVLLSSSATAGTQNCVELWATNITSGSQAVVFNVV